MQPAGLQQRKRSLHSCSKQTSKVRLSPRCSSCWQLLLALQPPGAARSICKGKDTQGTTARLPAMGLERADENRCHVLFLMSLSSPDHGLLSGPLSLPLPLLYSCFPSLSGSLLFPRLDLDQPFLALHSGCTPKAAVSMLLACPCCMGTSHSPIHLTLPGILWSVGSLGHSGRAQPRSSTTTGEARPGPTGLGGNCHAIIWFSRKRTWGQTLCLPLFFKRETKRFAPKGSCWKRGT